jgi:hypothetical protein
MSAVFASQPIFVITNIHLYLFQIMLKLGWVESCHLTIKLATVTMKVSSLVVSMVMGRGVSYYVTLVSIGAIIALTCTSEDVAPSRKQ